MVDTDLPLQILILILQLLNLHLLWLQHAWFMECRSCGWLFRHVQVGPVMYVLMVGVDFSELAVTPPATLPESLRAVVNAYVMGVPHQLRCTADHAKDAVIMVDCMWYTIAK